MKKKTSSGEVKEFNVINIYNLQKYKKNYVNVQNTTHETNHLYLNMLYNVLYS